MSDRRSLLEPLLGTPAGTHALALASQQTVRRLCGYVVPLICATTAASYCLAVLSLKPLWAQRVREQQFLADAAHELRTPLAAIALTAQAAEPADASTRSALGTIISTALDASATVADLLLLARQPKLHTRSTDPLELTILLRDLVADYTPSTLAVNFICRDSASIYVRGDGPRLARLVRNLLDNAVHHARAKIEIELAFRNQRALISVEDDGPGVSEADRERVFERFYSTRHDANGNGLGLAMCRWIARAHGGDINVQGARFTVWLPKA